MSCLTGYLDVEDAEDCIEKEVQLIDVKSYPVRDVLEILLQDKSAKKVKKNIIWATDAYKGYGDNCGDTSQIIPQVFFTGKQIVLQPRTEKALEQQQERTRKKAEVFTPVWLCNMMNNYADEEWFGRKDVFNHENGDHTWTVNEAKIQFLEGKTWKDYVDSRRLEITCGEAPYLVSRYDAATGDYVLPLLRRVGILDRKLRVVNENAESLEEWNKWVERAFQSCYGYEWQGDSLLIARINLLMTFYDYYKARWDSIPEQEHLKKIANVISWNIWQMDGQNDVVPFGKPYQGFRQMTLFDSFEENKNQETETVPCKIYDWRRDNSLLFRDCKSRGKMSKKMFDFVIGNPPYQEINDKNTRQPPVYHLFMDAAFKVGTAVELITPARFLSNAGQTPKEWNQQMLNDEHFKVLYFESDASKVFSNTEIKGGVAITYHDDNNIVGPIGTFTPYPELNNIMKKVSSHNFTPLSEIVSSRGTYRFSEQLYLDHPEAKEYADTGTGNMIASNTLSNLQNVFTDSPSSQDCVKIIGRLDNKRVTKFIERRYLIDNEYLRTFNVLLAEANNNGRFGEVLTTTIIAPPDIGASDTFISIGCLSSKEEADNVALYLKTKFLRSLLGIKKVTQHNPKSVWVHIPILDFTPSSDIDWSKSIPEIDRQLYSKYHLSVEEMEFIETHVQEMN